MIRIGMISYWHVHAEDYTKELLNNPHTEMTAIWDEEPERGQQKADKYKVPFVASLEELLAREDVDAVVVDAPTNMHREVMVKAAQAGKHIFTEKVVAATQKELNEILAAVEAAGVAFVVSLPRFYANYTQTLKRLLAEEVLGELTYARVRLAHNGATADWLPAHFYNKTQCCGGALIDLGCHPMYLTRLFLGMPQTVSASFGYMTGKEVEDNAVATLSYANGAIGVVETGFVNRHSPFSIELHGKEGTLLFGFPEAQLRLISSKRSGEWETVELADGKPSAFDQWVTHIQEGTRDAENVALAGDLTRLMEAAYRSQAEGRPIGIAELQG